MHKVLDQFAQAHPDLFVALLMAGVSLCAAICVACITWLELRRKRHYESFLDNHPELPTRHVMPIDEHEIDAYHN